jgi:phosphomannomutase/phosphoglucomutase
MRYCVLLLLMNTYSVGTQMEDIVFREYDIRGKVGSELHIDQVYDVTRAIAYYYLEHNPAVKTVVIGMDGRTHSPAIKAEVSRALLDSGLDVVFVGVCSSPVVYFALHKLPVQAGIMVTASHNPKEYNGLKIDLGHTSLWGKEIQKIRTYYREGRKIENPLRGTEHSIDLIPEYIAYLKEQFAHLIGMDMPIVMDCGNGAAGTVVPKLINQMQWSNVELLYPEVDGTYPNHEADPSSEKNMLDVRRALATGNAQIGIGFDGDVDRMGAMTQEGTLVPADQLLALFARDIVQQHPGLGVVSDVNASDGLVLSLNECGAQMHFSPCGASIVKAVMEKHQALLGGELSCHFFFADRYFGYDDGVYAALRLLELVYSSKESFSSMLSFFPKKHSSRVYRVPCREEEKFALVEYAKNYFMRQTGIELITLDGIRVHTEYGWGLIRASNTQSMLSLRFESDTVDGLKAIKEYFVHALDGAFDTAILWQQLELGGMRETRGITHPVEWVN